MTQSATREWIKAIDFQMENKQQLKYNKSMTETANDTVKLQNEIKRIDARIDALSARLDKATKVSMEFDELLRKHLNLLESYHVDAFERIKNIELKIFPNLADDITRLHNVIGDGDDKALNPLDRRKP